MAKISSNHGTTWRADEIDLVVADYFDMLEAELRGERPSKAGHRRILQKQVDRNRGSIDFKRGNISAVLGELGLPWIEGYKPAPNYQEALIEAVERHLKSHPAISEGRPDVRAAAPINEDFADVIVPPPAPRSEGQERKAAPLVGLIRKFDPAANDERNRALGKAGEQFVYDFEKWSLRGVPKYANNVRWVSRDDGDGAGYDIESFDPAGRKKLIEVKTTSGFARTPFKITRNECRVAKDNPESYLIYRVFEFDRAARLFTVKPPLEQALRMEAAVYEARPK